nr:MAG TPA: Chitinase C [Caudoviricetes sp.]
MLNVINVPAQEIAANQNVIFNATRVKSRRCGCQSGWLNHIEGSGLFTITNRSNQPMAVELQFNANVTASAAGATALALKLNGENVGGTEMDYTVVTADVYQNVSADTLIPVPAGTSLTVSVGNISAGAVLVKDANLIIKKLS